MENTFYNRYIKTALDRVLGCIALFMLSWLYLIIAIAILIDDPGPVLFKQKRVGKNKDGKITYFNILKFRTMKKNTPHDMPTHLLENPEQWITRVGKFLRKTSLDELPQIWNIAVLHNLSIVGPRPALWNQYDLIEEREKYKVNDVMPGLTGWAQINGRDELEIAKKAELDGEYAKELKKSSRCGFFMDVRCFNGTITSVLKHEGVVEGGTGEMNKEKTISDNIGLKKEAVFDYSQKKRVLITGAGSYIGESFKNYAKTKYKDNFEIDVVDMIDGSWENKDFSMYDTVFHVAGLAHADVGNVSREVKAKYYAVNTDLAIKTAKKAKDDKVSQFVFMSSMIIYGESAPFGKKCHVTKHTKPNPANFYGDSKWQADKGVRALEEKDYKVTVLRPPMIYGKGSKGNYPTLAKLAKKLMISPNIQNERSMLHIDNLCEFICKIILLGEGGIFFPQNAEYTKTSEMVKQIAKVSKHRIFITSLLNPVVWIASKVPGKISGLVNKAFGNMTYDKSISEYPGLDYRVVDFEDSIIRTERQN